MPFYNGVAVAGLGVSKLSTSSITLATTATGATVNLIPGAGFKLSEAADMAAFDVSTDNFTGYSVSLVAADDEQTLINTVDSTKIINSIANPVEQTNFVTTNSALNNRWGVKPNKYRLNGSTITNTTTILPAPDREGIELDVTTSANSTGNHYSVAIGAMVDGTLAAGSYNRATNLVVTPNAIYYLINYADNTGDTTVANLPSTATSGSVTVTSVTLDSTIPTRSGYVFDGWCLGTVSDDGATCTGTKYAAGANFGIDQTVDNTNITFYATWRINEYTITYGTVEGITSVSLDGVACDIALSSGGCTKRLTYNETYDLTAALQTGYSFTAWNAGDYGSIADAGATTTYTVGAGNSTITPTTTVNTYAITFGTTTGIFKVTLDGQECTTTLAAGGCVKTLTYGQSYSLLATVESGYSFTSWSAGTYGSVASATADSTNYTVGAGVSTITPTATTNKYSLAVTFAGMGVSSVQVRTASGTGGTLMGTVSTSGGTVSNLTYGVAYYLYPVYATGYTLSAWAKTSSLGTLSSTSAANPTFTMGAENGAVTITGKIQYTIQDFTTSLCSANASSANFPVMDVRDNQIYTVRYINGGCWMTKNIAIGCNGASISSKSLNSTYSNVSSTWSTPTTSLTSGDNYSEPRMTCSSTYGAWYNYTAASAGTISGNSTTAAQTYDICPKNWHLPSHSQLTGLNTATYKAAFSPLTGGYYQGGNIVSGFGVWWSSTTGVAGARHNLSYDGTNFISDKFSSGSYNYRGFYVRCVHK